MYIFFEVVFLAIPLIIWAILSGRFKREHEEFTKDL